MDMDSRTNKVFVQRSGEIEYGVEVPGEKDEPYTGPFTTEATDYDIWPDNPDFALCLEFTPPGFDRGEFSVFWLLLLAFQVQDNYVQLSSSF